MPIYIGAVYRISHFVELHCTVQNALLQSSEILRLVVFLDKLQIMMIARPALPTAPPPHSASCVHSIHHHEHIYIVRTYEMSGRNI